MNGEHKIWEAHRSRAAVIYLRQSSMAQVREHTESTMRQYALAEEAIRLGWARSDVDVIDLDLGVSGRLRRIWAGPLRWGRLTHARVLGVLKNPAYAGLRGRLRVRALLLTAHRRSRREDPHHLGATASQPVADADQGPPRRLHHLGDYLAAEARLTATRPTPAPGRLARAVRWSSGSQMAFGYWIVVQAFSGMAVIAFRTEGFIRTVTENHAFVAVAAAMRSCR